MQVEQMMLGPEPLMQISSQLKEEVHLLTAPFLTCIRRFLLASEANGDKSSPCWIYETNLPVLFAQFGARAAQTPSQTE